MAEAELAMGVVGGVFGPVTRRAKYLLFPLHRDGPPESTVTLIGHLGMTGRIGIQSAGVPLPKHTAVSFDLGGEVWVFEDTRYFGRLTLDSSPLETLGPEPLAKSFTAEAFARALGSSSQAIKVRLMDQRVVAGVGNIYASEALFRAGISPLKKTSSLTAGEVVRLRDSVREVLQEAVDAGSTLPADGAEMTEGLYYYGAPESSAESPYVKRLWVYDRAGQPCRICGAAIRREVQAARSTFYCPGCQRGSEG